MIVQTLTQPNQCPKCQSFNLTAEEPRDPGSCAIVICDDCDAWMVTPPGAGSKPHYEGSFNTAPTSYTSCPHCGEADEIMVRGGDEWCQTCGLNPNEEGYSVDQLSHLWKKGSGIRHMMEGVNRRSPAPTVGSRMYEFLTTRCGPHCTKADICSQTRSEFAVCLQRAVGEKTKGGALKQGWTSLWAGQSSRSQGCYAEDDEVEEVRYRPPQPRREPTVAKEVRAVVAYAKPGWYERKLNCSDESKNPQESTHRGGGSGAS